MAAKPPRHVSEVVIEHPLKQRKRLHLYGYTAVTIAAMTDQHYSTVARHIKDETLVLKSLESVRQYLAKHIKPTK